MSEDNNKKMPLESDDLWLQIVNEGVEDRVEVNQRMLIDKMLARYSSDFVVLREFKILMMLNQLLLLFN
jgi:hypothetical protein